MDEIRWEAIQGRVDYNHGLEFRSYRYEIAMLKSTGSIKNGKISFNIVLDSRNSDKKMVFTINLDNDRRKEHVNIMFYSDGNIEIYEEINGSNKQLASLRKNIEKKEDIIGSEKVQIDNFKAIDCSIIIEIYGSVISIFRNNIEVLSANKITNHVAQINANFEGQGFSIIKKFAVKNMGLAAFVVMEFSENFENFYTKVIKTACERQNILCFRADEILSPGKVTSDILEAIREADVIIAEATPDNANVYFELGYAVAFNKSIIPLVEKGKREKLPFDTHDFRTIFYENTEQGIDNAINKISNFLQSINDRTFEGSVYRQILMNEHERRCSEK